MDNRTIGRVIRTIEQDVKNWTTPAVTLVAERSGRSPYKVLISTILSLRTKDKVTEVASFRLFKRADTPERMLRLRQTEIEKLIYPAGFYKTKAATILRISSELIRSYDGNVPDEIDELLKFKGVGRKTANLVLIEGFDKPAMCVDVHVHRISNRLGYIKTKNPDESEFALRKKLAKKHWKKYNELLVTFGQNQCVPVSPFCSSCRVESLCAKVGVTRSR